MPRPFFVTELTLDTAAGKAFDGFATGTFIDMRGYRITVEPDELDEYVINTKSLIESTRTESGELVGLPIDPKDHNRDDAAGWITDVYREGDIIRFVANWTKLGIEKISEGLQRFFSSTFDTQRKVIEGGTLTNWPASRDIKTGEILLRPIELSRRMYRVELQEDPEESREDELNKVHYAWYEISETMEGPEPWILETFDDHIVIQAGEHSYQVTYTVEDGNIAFAPREEWVEVRDMWVEVASSIYQQIRAIFGNRRPEPQREQEEPEGNNMTVELTDLKPEERAQLAKGALAEALSEEGGLTALGGDISTLINARVQERVDRELKEQEAKRAVADTVAELVGGTEEKPVGVPVQKEQLEEFLLRLPEDERKAAIAILVSIRDKGLIELQESGHGKNIDGKKELPEYYAAKLTSGDMSIDDLKADMIQAEIGDPTQYDLSKWVEA